MMEKMPLRILGRTRLSVSALGFGAAPMGLLETAPLQAELILHALLDAGVNLMDTAASYGGAEETMGQVLGHRREECVLVSKGGQGLADLPGEAWSEKHILATIERSLQRLRTDRLDVMLLHSCSLEILQRGEALGALAKAREEGKIRFAGYSGDNEAAAFAAAHPEVAVVEVSLNLADQASIDEVLPVAREHDTGVIAKRPIANAAWKPLEAQPGFYRDYARPYHERFLAMDLRLDDLELGAEVPDWAEVALRFTLSQPEVHTAIIGTTNPLNVQRNARAAGRGPLPVKTADLIRQAFNRARKQCGEAWPGLM